MPFERVRAEREKMSRMAGTPLRIALERGRAWVFATAIDWPGWSRRAKGNDEAAVRTLLDHADRYAALAGKEFRVGEPTVIGVVAGSGAIDFGAPDGPQPWDDDPLTGAELTRHVRLLQASWAAFDQAVAGSAAQLRKGPRGGGRDRDAIVEHVREAERSYARRIGVRLPPRTPWPEQRTAIAEALGSGQGAATGWPPRYLIRRAAWHVLDHAWEIEDKQP